MKKWIKSFQLSNNTETDRHITDFLSPDLERKEWLKKGFLLSEDCQDYIDSHGYPIRFLCYFSPVSLILTIYLTFHFEH